MACETGRERWRKRGERFWNGRRNRLGRGWLTGPKGPGLRTVSIPAGLDERGSEDKGVIERLPCRYSGLARKEAGPPTPTAGVGPSWSRGSADP